MKKQNSINMLKTRYNPDFRQGLSIEEVAKQKENGAQNITKDETSKSYGKIIIGNLFTFFNIIIIFLIGWLPAERIKRKYKSFILSFHPKNIVFPDMEKTLVLYISYLVAILFILKNKPYRFKSYRSRAHNASLYFTVS